MTTIRTFAACLALLCSAAAVPAQTVLERVAGGGKLVVAHRESSVPFSYMVDGKPVGYAVDLCLRIADAVRTMLLANPALIADPVWTKALP